MWLLMLHESHRTTFPEIAQHYVYEISGTNISVHRHSTLKGQSIQFLQSTVQRTASHSGLQGAIRSVAGLATLVL